MVVSGDDVKQYKLESKTAFIFDMDGVVIDSEPLHERASQRVFSAYGIELDNAVFEPFKGKTDRDIVTFLIAEHNIQDATVDELLQKKRDSYAGLINELNPVPGAISFIQQLSANYRLAKTFSQSID